MPLALAKALGVTCLEFDGKTAGEAQEPRPRGDRSRPRRRGRSRSAPGAGRRRGSETVAVPWLVVLVGGFVVVGLIAVLIVYLAMSGPGDGEQP